MKLFKKLNQSGVAHLAALAVVVVAVAAVGTYMLVVSHAQTPPKKGNGGGTTSAPDYVSYNSAQTLYQVPTDTGGVNMVSDFVSALGTVPVAQVTAGTSANFGGKGGGNAVPIVDKVCYTLRATAGGATVSLWGVNSSQQFNLADTSTTDTAYSEICLTPSGTPTTNPGYALKVITGTVLVYQNTRAYHY